MEAPDTILFFPSGRAILSSNWKRAALSIDKELNVDRAIVAATDLSLMHLMETGNPIHPLAIDVRNYYLARVKSRIAGEQNN